MPGPALRGKSLSVLEPWRLYGSGLRSSFPRRKPLSSCWTSFFHRQERLAKTGCQTAETIELSSRARRSRLRRKWPHGQAACGGRTRIETARTAVFSGCRLSVSFQCWIVQCRIIEKRERQASRYAVSSCDKPDSGFRCRNDFVQRCSKQLQPLRKSSGVMFATPR